jgi:hypothetical protein
MTTTRNTALNSLRDINETFKQNIGMDVLKREMALAESDAVQQFVRSRREKSTSHINSNKSDRKRENVESIAKQAVGASKKKSRTRRFFIASNSFPEQIVVEGAGIPQVNGVYNMVRTWNGVPEYSTKSPSDDDTRVEYRLHRGSKYWWIAKRGKIGFVVLHTRLETHYSQFTIRIQIFSVRPTCIRCLEIKLVVEVLILYRLQGIGK